MEHKIFETNQELENYLLSVGFVDVTAKVFPTKEGKKAFKKKNMKVEFDYINSSIIRGNGILFWCPEINKAELDSFLGLSIAA